MGIIKSKIEKLRKIQTLVSIILFFSVFVFCWYVTGFNIFEIQLSKWGNTESVSLFWNSIVCLLSVSMFINTMTYIRHDFRLKFKNVGYLLFGFVFLNLFLVGYFDVSYGFIHNLSAYVYFFTYPLVIFIFNYVNKGNITYKHWVTTLIMSISMVILPLVFIWQFSGMAISEIVHTIIVVIWNLYIVFKK